MKTCLVLTSMFECFLSVFGDLGLILGGPGDPENRQKIEKYVFGMLLERPWDFLPISNGYWAAFG